MVIDTGCGPRQGREILAAVREKTQLPLVVVNTHAHYDHFFGNAVFADDGVTEFWAHANCAATIERDADNQRRFVATNEPEMAAGGRVTPSTSLSPTHWSTTSLSSLTLAASL